MFLTTKELEAGLSDIEQSPKNEGSLELIVRRPDVGEREVMEQGELDIKVGLVGDNWLSRGFDKAPDGAAHPDMQLNIMNARAIALIAQSKDRWKLAGDQFYVDLDLSKENLPPGTQLEIGSAVVEITAEPHLGCKKFMDRYGRDAAIFVNSEVGKRMNIRGVNAKVIQPGVVTAGAVVKKLPN